MFVGVNYVLREAFLMLMVLSEINCLNFLNAKNVYPDEFYTDFELFKHKVMVMQGVDVIVIFAGSCNFGKRILQEFINILYKRAKDETDGGIRSVCTITDTVLPKIDKYYMYNARPDKFYECSGWKKGNVLVDVWSDYVSDYVETKVFLEHKDLSSVGEAIDAMKDEDDELLEIIKVPRFYPS